MNQKKKKNRQLFRSCSSNCRHGFLNHTWVIYFPIYSNKMTYTFLIFHIGESAAVLLLANWAISPHNGKKQSTLLLNKERFAERAFTTELFWCVRFFKTFFCVVVTNGGKVCVWMRTYSSAKLISSLRVIMEQCFPVTVDGITFSRVTKAGLFESVYITIWYYSKSWLQFTFAVFSMHEIRF